MSNLDDLRARARAALPNGWFPDTAPVLDAVVAGMVAGSAVNADQLDFARAQGRVATATGSYLEVVAQDYFGFGNFPRRKAETDASYRLRIKHELLRPRGSRPAMEAALTDLTGFAPVIFVPSDVRDTAVLGRTFALGAGGRMGTKQRPFECYIRVRRPPGQGIPRRFGLGSAALGKTFATMTAADVQGNVTDAEIMQCVKTTAPAGVTCWVLIQSGPLAP